MTIGVDLGGTNIRAGIRIGDTVADRRQTRLGNKDSLENTLQQLKDLIRPLMSDRIRGIGVAVPSIVDTANGVVYNVVNIPSWERVELKAILETEFGIPVQIENDANCFALGEHRHGMAKEYRTVVGITLGTGVGSGLILDGRLFRGGNGGAGEIGYLNYRDRDFEFYGGSFFFADIHNTNALNLYQSALNGDTRAREVWIEYGTHIGELIKSVVYAYDPDVIVFGGSIANAYAFFEPSFRRAISGNFHFPHSMKALNVFRSENENIILLGASSLPDTQ